VHVTLRAVRRIASLRSQRVFEQIRRAFSRTDRSWFRIVHFSVQVDHVHMLVEAEDKTSLTRGLMGAIIRLARAINRVLRRRGCVWSDRYHARALRTPREVRNGIVYVLMNWKKHSPLATSIDPCSSARAFTGWKGDAHLAPATGPPIDRATTWLLRAGWKRHGLIGVEERPKGAR
jgi:REP element-mobilizing transposase RayT